MRRLGIRLLCVHTVALLFSVLFASNAAMAETIDCTPINSLPAVITEQGIHCFTKDLTTAITSGYAIEIQTNNVTIDMNGWKLGGLQGGLATTAVGIYAYQKKNITIKNGIIRGFRTGVRLGDVDPYTASSGHLIEDLVVDENRVHGVHVEGTGCMIRNNRVVNTGGNTTDTSAIGIYVFGPGQRILNNDVQKVSVSGDNAALFGFILATGIRTTFAPRVVIAGNRVSDLYGENNSGTDGSYGIDVNSSANATIRNNVISNATSAGGTNGIGIYIGTGSNSAAVRGNDVNHVLHFGISTTADSVCANNIIVDAGTPWENCLDGGNNYPTIPPP